MSYYVEIPIEEARYNNEISELACSPNSKHVAALHENRISFWSIVDQEEHLEFVKAIKIDNIRRNETINAISDNQYILVRKIFAISDNMQVSISLDRIDPYNFKIFDFETPDEEIKLTFPDWQKEIDFLSFTNNGNIVMYFEISHEEELLIVCAKNKETKRTRLYSFSTETGINLAFFDTSLAIYRFHLIASGKAERLLCISGNQYKLMDPYNLKDPIDANELIKNINYNQIQEPYIIRSDIIIYITNEKLSIKELIPDNWVKYLRKTLQDYNSITAPSKKTVEMIKEVIKDSEEKELLNINGKNFILHCEILENDDFVTITRIGVIIWTYIKFGDRELFKEFLQSNIDEEFYLTCYGKVLMKTLIELKDDKWIRSLNVKYYFLIWAGYAILLGSFIIVSAFSDSISWFYQQILLYIVIILGFWHLFVEFRQVLVYSPKNYLSTAWNYLDLAATISTTATSIYWLKNGSAPTWAITFSSLFLEMNFINLCFRPIKFFGIYLAMIMNTVDRVISFVTIFGCFTLALANSLYLLLRSTSESFQGSNINMFEQLVSSIIATYYMIITGTLYSS
ncbi:transient receptor potential cation channel subfamily a member 1-like [Gigaspora margarita]|uniref:Transient receptor potential cation channel subfamily a member 1-like n=1 Tax=Gigaspora margarita TaxID=4874 RepID=A0A8H4AR66_GIGMA|nr:transient receptor potential cation channel subfamily a member 1-like [Gigaspora margarita]